MSNDVRAAAEMVLRNKICECDADVGFVPCFDCAVRDLASCWLREHPADDDDPASCNFIEELPDAFATTLEGFTEYELGSQVSARWFASTDHCSELIAVYVGATLVLKNPTRGQLRRLIPSLTEPTT